MHLRFATNIFLQKKKGEESRTMINASFQCQKGRHTDLHTYFWEGKMIKKLFGMTFPRACIKFCRCYLQNEHLTALGLKSDSKYQILHLVMPLKTSNFKLGIPNPPFAQK